MRIIVLGLATVTGLAACALHSYDIAPMTASIRAEVAVLPDTLLRTAIIEYVTYLDSLRIINSREARSELGKLNQLTLASFILGGASAGYALSGASEKSKARIAGWTGIMAAFAASLASQFRHKEDSQAYRVCSRQLELVLTSFIVPDSAQQFDSTRSAIQAKLDTLDCLAPLDH